MGKKNDNQTTKTQTNPKQDNQLTVLRWECPGIIIHHLKFLISAHQSKCLNNLKKPQKHQNHKHLFFSVTLSIHFIVGHTFLFCLVLSRRYRDLCLPLSSYNLCQRSRIKCHLWFTALVLKRLFLLHPQCLCAVQFQITHSFRAATDSHPPPQADWEQWGRPVQRENPIHSLYQNEGTQSLHDKALSQKTKRQKFYTNL